MDKFIKKIDIYIIRKYLFSFFYTMILISIVAIAMDSSERMDKFISNKLGLGEVLRDYYLHFVPWINGELWPLFAFLSVIFFTSRMARDSETIALFSAGIDYARILRPMLIAAGLIAIIHWIGENYIIPKSTYQKTEFESRYIKRTLKSVVSSDVQFFIGPKQKIYGRYFQQSDSTIKVFRLEQFDSSGILLSMFKADELRYREDIDKWTARDFEIRTFQGMQESVYIGKNEGLDTTLALHPSDFIRHSKQMEIMTTPALRQFIEVEKARGLDNTVKYQIEVYKRTASPFTILILTLIGATIGSRKVRGGMGIHLAYGVGLGALFVFISKFSETFANNLSFVPILGVWLPNLLFGGFSVFLYRRAQK